MLSKDDKIYIVFLPQPVSNDNSEKYVTIKEIDRYASGQNTLRIDFGGGAHDGWRRYGYASTASTCRRF